MVLNVRESAKFINENSKHITINDDKIQEFCKLFSDSKIPVVDFSHPLHPNCISDCNYINWIFLIDSLNFCFWTRKNEPKWCVTYDGIQYTGYFALCAAIKKALDSGLDLTNPTIALTLSIDDLRNILKGDNEAHPKLIEERHKFVLDVSKTLIDKYQGSFENVVKKAEKSAIKLLSIIIEDFPSFRDESIFHGTKVSFYKRAQILIADLYFCTRSSPIESPCDFKDINQLTMFADYRVPQVLKYFGILQYSDELMKALKG